MINREAPHTACHDCIFAVWKDKTQTGCSVGRLDTYKKKFPDKVIEATDNNINFYVINDKICNMKSVVGDPTLVSLDQRQKIRPHYAAILQIDNFSFNKDEIKAAIQNLLDQDIEPSVIYVLTDDSDIYLEAKDILEKQKIKWHTHYVITDLKQELKHIITKIKQKYVLYTTLAKLPKNIFSKLDQRINDDLEPTVLVEFDSGWIVNTFVLKTLYSIENIKLEDSCKNLTINLNQLVI